VPCTQQPGKEYLAGIGKEPIIHPALAGRDTLAGCVADTKVFGQHNGKHQHAKLALGVLIRRRVVPEPVQVAPGFGTDAIGPGAQDHAGLSSGRDCLRRGETG
jgi:hypothetical protein